ncbi:unnamed protein product [Angiostrongylus costaricensis]|uniref:DDE Tnp4 domain-containing protein n=1 Tax=Angiostrongylus costaricensis TaxID=334426 RepID=A0A0R3Q1A2_ANGCS|nr:unnamed protein product [Angiostrongylus costaricensis]
MRRRHPFNAAYDTGEELFPERCDGAPVGSVGIIVDASLVTNLGIIKQRKTRIGCVRLKRCGSIAASKTIVVYAPIPNYDGEEIEAFYMDLDKFRREDHTFFKVIPGDINAKIGPRRTSHWDS